MAWIQLNGIHEGITTVSIPQSETPPLNRLRIFFGAKFTDFSKQDTFARNKGASFLDCIHFLNFFYLH